MLEINWTLEHVWGLFCFLVFFLQEALAVSPMEKDKELTLSVSSSLHSFHHHLSVLGVTRQGVKHKVFQGCECIMHVTLAFVASKMEVNTWF